MRDLAELARLDLAGSELPILADQLHRLLEHFGQIAELDTAGVLPTAYPTPIDAPERADRSIDCSDASGILSQAPRTEDGFFLVPKVLD